MEFLLIGFVLVITVFFLFNMLGVLLRKLSSKFRVEEALVSTGSVQEIGKKGKKISENKKIKEKKTEVNPEAVGALIQLGFQKSEATEAVQKAIQNVGQADDTTLIREALREL